MFPNQEEIQKQNELREKSPINSYIANSFTLNIEDYETVTLKMILATTGINAGFDTRIKWIRYKYLHPNSVAVPGITPATYNKYASEQYMIDTLKWYTEAKENGYFSKTFGVEAFSRDDIRQILVFILEQSKKDGNYDSMLRVTRELIDLEGLRINKNEIGFSDNIPVSISINAINPTNNNSIEDNNNKNTIDI